MSAFDNLAYFRAFYQVARGRSISQAARALDVSQPAVSASIKSLEKQLGCPLLVRTARGSELTPEGTVLFQELEPAFGHIERALARIQELKELQTGLIRIGFDGLVSSLVLKDALASFKEAHPGVSLILSKIYLPEILQDLERGMIDCAVLCTIQAPFDGHEKYQDLIGSSSFTAWPITSLVDDFVVGPKYAALSGGYTPISRLADVPLIYPTIEVQGSEYYTSILSKLAKPSAVSLPVSGALSRLSLVRFNHGYTYFPSLFLRRDYEEGKLFPVFTDIRMRQYDLRILVRSKQRPSPALERFLSVIRAMGDVSPDSAAKS